MKIEIKQIKPTNPWNEPRLVISVNNKHIILTNGEQGSTVFTGTVIFPNGNIHAKIGQYSTSWDKDSFIPFEGEIKLSN